MKTIICLLLLITSIGTYASQFNHITLIIDNETKHDVVLYRVGFSKGRNHIYPFTDSGNNLIFVPAGKKIIRTDYATDRFNQILTYASKKYIYTSYGISPQKNPDWIFSLYHNFNDIIIGNTSAAVGS